VPCVDLPSIVGAAPARVLAVKLSSFGDIVHVTGALRAMRAALPHAHITVAIEERWRDVLRHDPSVNAFVESSSSELTASYVADVFRRLGKHERFDVAIDFQGTRRSATWVYLSRARVKIGRGVFRPGWQSAVAPDLTRHAVQVSADICRACGIPIDDLDPCLHTGPADEARLDGLLDDEGIPRKGFVLLNPFSRWTSKSWPEDATAEFIRGLRALTSCPPVLTGGEEDGARAARLLARLPPGSAASLVGRLPLGVALCLFRRARLMVSCDSGPMHAAAAFGVPVVALFGPTHPERTGPWGARHIVVQARRPPSHHAYREDAANEYMRALDSRIVFDAVSRALNSGPASS
jgi:heptosyltransferase-1